VIDYNQPASGWMHPFPAGSESQDKKAGEKIDYNQPTSGWID
jgi:hypothetical protein